MQGAQEQDAGLGRGDGRGDRIVIAHFPEQDDVGAFTQGRPQGVEVAGRVDRDLSLGDDRLVVPVDVLDGVFHCNDVRVAVVVDAVDDARERGGFAGAGRAGDEDEAFLVLGEREDAFRDAEFDGVGQAEFDDPYNGGERAALAEYVHTESAEVADGKRKVVVISLLDVGLVAAAGLVDLVDQCLDGLGQHPLFAADLVALAFEGHGKAGDDEDVTGFLRDGLLQYFLDIHGELLSCSVVAL